MLQHRLALRRGYHQNNYLQAAWNKYGEKNFDYSILEITNEEKLLDAEQKWIDSTNCANHKVGFNISKVVGSTGELYAQLWEGFITPDGDEIIVFNLHKFCRKHNLDFPSMHRLAMGKSKLKSHKGWTHKNSVRIRDYVKTYDGLISPEGKSVGPITNLAAFCRENGLDNTHLVAVVNGRILSHKGWTYKHNRKRMDCKTYHNFINPQGKKVTITNLAAFCRENNLSPVHMHNIISGIRKSHKGWTWREDNE